MGVHVDLIEPAGFEISDKALKRAGMDYLEMCRLQRHPSWENFNAWRLRGERRLILFTTKACVPYTAFAYKSDDILLFGRESAGVPDFVHQAAAHRLVIPIRKEARSLNLAISVAMAVGEATRQAVNLNKP